jgi:hypothetical protein
VKKLPETDSIRELAAFWDTHQITDFDHSLQEVDHPVFVRGSGNTVAVPLTAQELKEVRRIAAARGVPEGAVIHAVETAWNILDLLLNWRIYACVLFALGVALLLAWFFPELAGGVFYSSAVFVGIVIGFIWEWRST